MQSRRARHAFIATTDIAHWSTCESYKKSTYTAKINVYIASFSTHMFIIPTTRFAKCTYIRAYIAPYIIMVALLNTIQILHHTQTYTHLYKIAHATMMLKMRWWRCGGELVMLLMAVRGGSYCNYCMWCGSPHPLMPFSIKGKQYFKNMLINWMFLRICV